MSWERDGSIDPNVDAGFEPPIVDEAMPLLMELEPLLDPNGGTTVNDVG